MTGHPFQSASHNPAIKIRDAREYFALFQTNWPYRMDQKFYETKNPVLPPEHMFFNVPKSMWILCYKKCFHSF